MLCFVCGNSGATVICAERGCERRFHLPCAPEGQCITQYTGALRTFCWEHRPQQAVQAAPAPNTTCVICMEPVDDSRSYRTMVCPVCQHAWFHRACIQEQALNAGIYCFRCPVCRERESFVEEMLTMGIRIPNRNPTWEANNAYAALTVRSSRCDASICLYPHGREQSGEGPWELLICSSCAGQATHRRCSLVSNSTTNWECNVCAGEGTGKMQTAACCWAGARRGLAAAAQSGPAQIPPARDKRLPEELTEAHADIQGGPGLEAARLSIVGLPRPTASPEDTAGAGPGGEGQPRGGAAPGYHVGPSTSPAGPNDAVGAAVYKLLFLTIVI
ncbi:PHD finger protein 7-like [Coturnix japonica]|uniref:PHD finger protein 7-like n=1 Tax=Coturnix japonica TaxID=93934 RepID=UPI0013A5CD1D|nr:PHD finger protein 7-like [Coturnix japonica]